MSERPPDQPLPGHSHAFPALDALRALATLAVFVNHVSYKTGGPVLSNFEQYITQRNNDILAPAIAIFFVLSGFLLYRPFVAARWQNRRRPAVRAYLARRALRIVPAYWVALPIIALVLSRDEVFSGSGPLTYFGFLQIYDQTTFQNGVAQAWTLDVDVPFYLALPLLAIALRHWRVTSRRQFLATELGVLGLIVGASMAWQAWVFEKAEPNKFFPGLLSLPGSADLIAMGMMLAAASVAFGDEWPRIPFRIVERVPWVAVVAAGAIYWAMPKIGVKLQDERVVGWWVIHLLKGVFAILVILPAVVGRTRRDLLRRFMGSRLVRYFSDRSYAFYLWHLAAIDLIADAGLRGRVGAVGLVIATFAATLTAAELSWHIVEKPALLLGRRFTRGASRRPELAAAETAPR